MQQFHSTNSQFDNNTKYSCILSNTDITCSQGDNRKFSVPLDTNPSPYSCNGNLCSIHLTPSSVPDANIKISEFSARFVDIKSGDAIIANNMHVSCKAGVGYGELAMFCDKNYPSFVSTDDTFSYNCISDGSFKTCTKISP